MQDFKSAGAAGPPGPLRRLANGGDRLSDLAGHLAAMALMCLAAGLILGTVLRWVHVDNVWTYDFDLFSLVWLAFLGAALTARRGRHVTAGIALETVVRGRAKSAFRLLRMTLVVVFLILFTVSGWWAMASSFASHETTIDVVEWPMWVAKLAVPVGTFFWAVAEASKIFRHLGGGAEGDDTGHPQLIVEE